MRRESALEINLSEKGAARARVLGLLSGIIFYSLLTLIALAAIPYGTVQPWWQALVNCCVFALAALWLVEGFVAGSWEAQRYRLLWPLLGLVLFGFVQSLGLWRAEESGGLAGAAWGSISADPHGTRVWALRMLALVLVAAMLMRYAVGRGRLRALVLLVLCVALASAVYGLLRQMMQHETGFILPNLKQGFGYGQFVNKNHFAFLAEMGFGLVLGLAMSGRWQRELRLVLAGLALLLGGALVLANSRGGILALLCQLLFAALLFPIFGPGIRAFAPLAGVARGARGFKGGAWLVRLLLLGCLALVMTAGIMWIGGDPLVGNFEAVQTEVGAPDARVRWGVRRWDIWPATLHLIEAHPLVGSGFGGYWMAITAYHQGSGEKSPQEAHNDYLELLASGGLIGLALGLWFLYLFIREARARLREADAGFERASSLGAILGLAGPAVHSLFDFGLHVTVNALIFMVLLVLATRGRDARPFENIDRARRSAVNS